MTSALEQAERIVDQLSVDERKQLSWYIQKQVPTKMLTQTDQEQTVAAWERIKQIGAALDKKANGAPSALSVLREMRDSRY